MGVLILSLVQFFWQDLFYLSFLGNEIRLIAHNNVQHVMNYKYVKKRPITLMGVGDCSSSSDNSNYFYSYYLCFYCCCDHCCLPSKAEDLDF